jgi:hypothetical protein
LDHVLDVFHFIVSNLIYKFFLGFFHANFHLFVGCGGGHVFERACEEFIILGELFKDPANITDFFRNKWIKSFITPGWNKFFSPAALQLFQNQLKHPDNLIIHRHLR